MAGPGLSGGPLQRVWLSEEGRVIGLTVLAILGLNLLVKQLAGRWRKNMLELDPEDTLAQQFWGWAAASPAVIDGAAAVRASVGERGVNAQATMTTCHRDAPQREIPVLPVGAVESPAGHAAPRQGFR